MTYKAIVLEDSSKAKHMAAAVEAKANEMASQGYSLVTMSITASGKAILVFCSDDCQTADEAEPQETTED